MFINNLVFIFLLKIEFFIYCINNSIIKYIYIDGYI